MTLLAAFLLTFSVVNSFPIDTRDCLENSEMDCMESFVDTVFYSDGKVDECRELWNFVDCSSDAIDECFGDERDGKVDKGLEQLENLSKDICGGVSSGDNSDFDEETYSRIQLTASFRRRRKKASHSTTHKETSVTSPSKNCFSERKQICWDTFEKAVFHSVFYSTTGLDKCSALQHFVFCASQAAESCFPDEQRSEDADEVIEVWGNKYKEICKTDIPAVTPVFVEVPTIPEKSGTCQKPPPPDNGAVECDEDLTPGKVCHFTCSEGYELRGSPIRHCMPDNMMSGGARCDRIPRSCQKPPPPDNGAVECDEDLTPGKVCRFTCSEGYELRGCMPDNMMSGSARCDLIPTTSSVRSDSEECTEERAEACINSLMNAALDNATETEICNGLRSSVDCLKKAVDDCFGDERDPAVDGGLEELKKALKDNCKKDEQNGTSNNDLEEQAAKCFDENEEYFDECFIVKISDEMTKLLEEGKLNANFIKCTMYSMKVRCFLERVGEKCGEREARRADEALSPFPDEIVEACEEAKEIETYAINLLEDKRRE